MTGESKLMVYLLMTEVVAVVIYFGLKHFREYRIFQKWQQEQEILNNPPSVLNRRLQEKDEIIRGLLKKIHSLETEVQRLSKRNVLLANEARYDATALTMPLDRVPNPGRFAHLRRP